MMGSSTQKQPGQPSATPWATGGVSTGGLPPSNPMAGQMNAALGQSMAAGQQGSTQQPQPAAPWAGGAAGQLAQLGEPDPMMRAAVMPPSYGNGGYDMAQPMPYGNMMQPMPATPPPYMQNVSPEDAAKNPGISQADIYSGKYSTAGMPATLNRDGSPIGTPQGPTPMGGYPQGMGQLVGQGMNQTAQNMGILGPGIDPRAAQDPQWMAGRQQWLQNTPAGQQEMARMAAGPRVAQSTGQQAPFRPAQPNRMNPQQMMQNPQFARIAQMLMGRFGRR